jgi:hypothetical protein
MIGFRKITRLGLVLSLIAPAPGVVACGGSQKSAQSVPKPGDMPEGGEWTGVYFSPTYGHLHLVKDGSALSGKWRTAAGDKWGQMSGEVTGNLYKFEWQETKIGMVGPSATTSGHGFFVYSRPPGDNVNDEIKGQWGLGGEYTGVEWDAVKQRNMVPDPNSVMPDETQKVEGSNWDEPKKKSSDEKTDDGWN